MEFGGLSPLRLMGVLKGFGVGSCLFHRLSWGIRVKITTRMPMERAQKKGLLFSFLLFTHGIKISFPSTSHYICCVLTTTKEHNAPHFTEFIALPLFFTLLNYAYTLESKVKSIDGQPLS